jgi:hypothetical protein
MMDETMDDLEAQTRLSQIPLACIFLFWSMPSTPRKADSRIFFAMTAAGTNR